MTFAALTSGAALFWSDAVRFLPAPSSAKQTRRVGRPATPMSYAGVASRTTRRSVAYGAAAGAAAAGAYYYAAPGCQQVVNAYGQIVYQCP